MLGDPPGEAMYWTAAMMAKAVAISGEIFVV